MCIGSLVGSNRFCIARERLLVGSKGGDDFFKNVIDDLFERFGTLAIELLNCRFDLSGSRFFFSGP